MLWSSVYGQYGNESGTDDAFRALLDALQERKMAYKLRPENENTAEASGDQTQDVRKNVSVQTQQQQHEPTVSIALHALIEIYIGSRS